MDKENIMIKEYTKSNGGAYQVDMVAIYNCTKISDDEATTIIQGIVENPNVIVVTKEQFQNVFG